MKQGQLEIIGISIVVVLLIGGLLLAVGLHRPEQKPMRALHLQQAHSYLSAVLETTADSCKKHSIKELIIDCMENGETGADRCDDGATSACQKYKGVLKESSEKTLGAWKKNYALEIVEIKERKEEGAIEKIAASDATACQGYNNQDVAEAYLPLKSGSARISLTLCY